MRELAVYYCDRCGYYGYYQLVKNAVCPKCDCKMVFLDMPYQTFMNMDCEERDEFLSDLIIEANPSAARILGEHQGLTGKEKIAYLANYIEELKAENERLNKTVDWMHQTIWELMRKQKMLEDSPEQ